jgi:hypothetical protein
LDYGVANKVGVVFESEFCAEFDAEFCAEFDAEFYAEFCAEFEASETAPFLSTIDFWVFIG